MPVGRRYTPYRRVLEELKLRQLDIYRYKDHEVLRVMTPDRRVVLIRLPRRRDEMTPEEFRKYVEEGLAAATKK
jgi:hypothetical protein